MARAALDHRNTVRLRQEPQHIGGLGAHILRARMAGEMQGDRPRERLQARRQPVLLGDVDENSVRSNVALARASTAGRGGIAFRHQQRPFELQHQRAARHQGDDVVALGDPGLHRRRNLARVGDDLADQPLLELRHAAAGGIDNFGLDAEFGQHCRASQPRSGSL